MTYIAIQAMKVCRIAYDVRLPKIRPASLSATADMALSGSSN
jgi:hypothetical protein